MKTLNLSDEDYACLVRVLEEAVLNAGSIIEEYKATRENLALLHDTERMRDLFKAVEYEPCKSE